MKRCVQIMLSMASNSSHFRTLIEKSAQQSGIEGMAFMKNPDQVRIVASGSDADIDKFIDLLYELEESMKPAFVDVEPYLESKDFRGLFRLIE